MQVSLIGNSIRQLRLLVSEIKNIRENSALADFLILVKIWKNLLIKFNKRVKGKSLNY